MMFLIKSLILPNIFFLFYLPAILTNVLLVPVILIFKKKKKYIYIYIYIYLSPDCLEETLGVNKSIYIEILKVHKL